LAWAACGEPFPGQDGSAGLYGLGNGSGFSIGDLRFGVGSPKQAGGFVQGCDRAPAGGGGMELVG
jgi:hypothetical protein